MNNKVKLFLLLVLVIAVVVLVLQNMVRVPVRFLWMRGELPAALLLFLTAAAGFLAGSSAGIIARSSKKKTR